MNNHSNSGMYRLTNEQILLISILNTMYEDNSRQINNMTQMVNNLHNVNDQIRTLFIQMLSGGSINSNIASRTNPRGLFNDRRSSRNNRLPSNSMSIPYIIDSFTEYTIPLSDLTSLIQTQTTGRNPNLAVNVNGNNGNRRGQTQNHFFENLLSEFLQPVEVYPTQTQIESATRRVRYCDISRPINTSCPIGMDEFNDNDMVMVIRQCGHIFNSEHLMNWFRTNCRCPVCRYDIRDYNSNNSREFFNTNNNSYNNNPNANVSTNIDLSSNNLSTNMSDLLRYIDMSGNYLFNAMNNNSSNTSNSSNSSNLSYLLETALRSMRDRQ
jgi:hypothetical protein